MRKEQKDQSRVDAMGDSIDSLTAAVNRAVPAWQPIDTAPDDEDVLLFMPDDGETEIAIGHRAEREWYPQEVSTLDGGPFPFDPTHWMPLPEAPQADDAVARGPRNG